MKNAMRGELNNYNQTGHDTSTYGWDSFQKTLGCCGVDSYKDWVGTNFDNKTGNCKKNKSTIFKTGENSRAIFSSEIGGLTQVPASCCKEDADCNPDGIELPASEQDIKAKIYTKGCVSTLQTILKDKKILIGISSFVILIGFFLAVVTSCNLARDMCEENMAEDPKYHRHSI